VVVVRIDATGIAHADALVSRIVANAVDGIAQDARRRVPVDTGELLGSIEGHQLSRTHGRVSVGTDHWAPTEYGSKPHIIRAHGPYSLHNTETGDYFGRVVHHPGTPAQPFMRPAAFTKRIPRTT
jgi:hypothetical protein